MHFTHRRRFRDKFPVTHGPDFDKTWATLTSATLTVGTPTAGDHGTPPQPDDDPVPLPSSTQLIGCSLTDFWENFDPDLHEDIQREPPGGDDIWDQIRLRTAPWGDDDWEQTDDDALSDTFDPPSSDDGGDAIEDDIGDPDAPSPPPSDDGRPSGPPLPIRLLPGNVHLLNPQKILIHPNATTADPSVDVPPAVRLRGPDARWYFNIMRHGIRLPRPRFAPLTFRPTRPSAAMDRVVAAWLGAGLLVVNPGLKYAHPMFLVPKDNAEVRPIIDYSAWTDYIVTPPFSLKSAALAVRDIPADSLLVKIDLKSGFHQLKIDPNFHNFNGIYYRGTKYSLTRLPMGHALAPSLFQRFALAVLEEVRLATEVKGIAYLDDWLLFSNDEVKLRLAVNFVRTMGITINESKSLLTPSLKLTYLGFKISAPESTIQLTLAAYDRLTHLLRFTRNGSQLDRKRIHGYASWILYNLRLPAFLANDILRGDASWLQAALRDLTVLQPKPLADHVIQVRVFTDATPHSIAAIIPALDWAYAQAFQTSEEINRAEAIAAMKGLQWASENLLDTHLILFTDNAAVFSTLRSGKGLLWRHHDLRRMFLSTLHLLRGNTWEVQPVIGRDNPADAPSRAILRTLHRGALRPETLPAHAEEGFHALPPGLQDNDS